MSIQKPKLKSTEINICRDMIYCGDFLYLSDYRKNSQVPYLSLETPDGNLEDRGLITEKGSFTKSNEKAIPSVPK